MSKDEEVFLMTEDGHKLITQDGKNIIAQKPSESTIAPTIPEPEQKTPSFRVPYEAMKMKTNYKDSLDILKDDTKELISETQASGNYNIRSIGIDLTPAEDRALLTFCKLLKDKSEHKNETSENFYQGNMTPSPDDLIPHHYNGTTIPLKTAQYSFTAQEYYRAYLGGEKPSGKHIRDINETLDSLSSKTFALRFQVPVGTDKKGEQLFDYYEGVDRLFSLVKVTKGVTKTEIEGIDKGDTQIRKDKGEFIVKFHALFTAGIANKYVNLPHDIYERIVKAAGHIRNVTQATNILRDYLLMRLRDMKLHKKEYIFEINIHNLYSLLKLDNFIKARKEKKAKEKVKKEIATLTKIGLILNAKETKGAEGQLKYIFALNEDFE